MSYSQDDKRIRLVTPSLGKDKLLLTGFSGREGISQPYRLQLDCLAPDGQAIKFDKLLGEPMHVEVELDSGAKRYFHGICNRISELGGLMQKDDGTFEFIQYRVEMVPKLWLLTRVAQSRVWQHLNVNDILTKVFNDAGLDVSFDLQGTFEPRDYLVQYRETDFNFASRVMEEEGIFYYFKHTADGHKMIVANQPHTYVATPELSTFPYIGATTGRITFENIVEWQKSQEIRSGKYTLYDHCFELPHKHLDADKTIQESVMVGTVSHKLKVGGNDKLEIYDYPGEYAQRFDGIDKSGGEQPAELDKIATGSKADNKRTVEIRMQQEALPSLAVHGSGSCRTFVSGYKFTLERHYDANGDYLLTSVSHACSVGDVYRTGGGNPFSYRNDFTCIPVVLPFRPQRVTPKPFVQGTHTAVVVGQKGEEIFTDKYGRVKVQFHFDREGKNDIDSSCWIRVATAWAGKQWGMLTIPRIGQEVIVAFQEGDPDQPIIVGSVYNAEQMPAYTLPDERTKSYLKSNTSLDGVGFNEIRFEDKKDKQQFFIHAQRNMDIRVRQDTFETVRGDRHMTIGSDQNGYHVGSQLEKVFEDKDLHVLYHQCEHIEGTMMLTIGHGDCPNIPGQFHLLIEKDRMEEVGGSRSLTVDGDQKEKVGSHSLSVGGAQNIKVGGDHNLEAKNIHIKAGVNCIIEATGQLSLKVGGSFVDISPAGVSIVGPLVNINSGGAAGSGPGAKPAAPDKPGKAEPLDPTLADNAKTGHKSCPA